MSNQRQARPTAKESREGEKRRRPPSELGVDLQSRTTNSSHHRPAMQSSSRRPRFASTNFLLRSVTSKLLLETTEHMYTSCSSGTEGYMRTLYPIRNAGILEYYADHLSATKFRYVVNIAVNINCRSMPATNWLKRMKGAAETRRIFYRRK